MQRNKFFYFVLLIIAIIIGLSVYAYISITNPAAPAFLPDRQSSAPTPNQPPVETQAKGFGSGGGGGGESGEKP